eukprot:TRINITY_DN17468_c0_g1_i3.p2 TRINITY_DN17468_c0_g1~~TRINITY_DN17468_c0_g1_i3.p2  ORF type:complete len:210 (+),score=29.62 TRINITY_DN17468_c0_g1_i3:270-899(+)
MTRRTKTPTATRAQPAAAVTSGLTSLPRRPRRTRTRKVVASSAIASPAGLPMWALGQPLPPSPRWRARPWPVARGWRRAPALAHPTRAPGSPGAKSIGAKVLGSGLLGALGWHHIAAGAVGGALLGGTGGVLLGGTAVHAAKLGAAVPAKIAVFHGPNCAAHPVSLVPAQLGRMPGLVHGGALNEAQRKILMANAGKFTTKASSDFLAT